MDTALEQWSDDFVWQDRTRRTFRAEARTTVVTRRCGWLKEAVDAWDDVQPGGRRVPRADGDTVVVLAHDRRQEGATQSAQVPVVHIWRYDGDQIKRLQILTDTLQTAELLGVR